MIMALIQCLMYFCIIIPYREGMGMSPFMGWQDLLLIIFATISIGAAGNAINDYFDMRIDRINKPEKMILGKYIDRRMAIVLNSIFNAVGVVLGFIVAAKMEFVALGFVFLILTFVLLFYSSTFKKRFLSGNLMISVLSGMVPLIIGLFESVKGSGYNNRMIWYVSLLYGLFAFLLTFTREVVKDIEDVQGDRQGGCRTIAVVLGIEKARNFVLYVHVFVLSLLLLLLSQLYLMQWWWLLSYALLAICLPMIWMVFGFKKAKEKKDFSKISSWYKWVMLLGILSALWLPFYIV